jgi:hypothetical protein
MSREKSHVFVKYMGFIRRAFLRLAWDYEALEFIE